MPGRSDSRMVDIQHNLLHMRPITAERYE